MASISNGGEGAPWAATVHQHADMWNWSLSEMLAAGQAVGRPSHACPVSSDALGIDPIWGPDPPSSNDVARLAANSSELPRCMGLGPFACSLLRRGRRASGANA